MKIERSSDTLQALGQESFLFEIAYEVCRRLGGIYTVLRSKAPAMVNTWGERYCLIGPWDPATAETEFEPREAEGPLAAAIAVLERQGVRCHFGRWLVGGNPQVLLIDTGSAWGRLDSMKYLLWADHGISTRTGDTEVDHVVLLGFLVRDFLEAYLQARHAEDPTLRTPVIAHCHEWMGAVAIPRVRHANLPVTTVFTTHATLLGRYLSSSEANLEEALPYIKPEQAAVQFNIRDRYGIERTCAHAAHVFTTVSEVTAREASFLLGRAPDLVLPNGLNIQRFTAIHEFQNLHREYKERIHQFTMSHFFSSYSFDLEKTLYFFTAGRYEHRNKGSDLFIEALARLNYRLNASKSDTTVVAFIIMPAAYRSINVDALRGRAMFEELRGTCRSISESIGDKLLSLTATGKVPDGEELFDPYYGIQLKRIIQARRTWRLPIICTHDLLNDATDPVLSQLRACQLINRPEDHVKVIFHPEFMNRTNPLLGLDYDHFVRGCHLGVFPSYYEPWGYTPMECVASGVPAVTSDLAGFGAYLQSHVPEHQSKGLFIINRSGVTFDRSAQQLAELMEWFCGLNRRQRVNIRNDVESMAEQFDWARLVEFYDRAHGLALRRFAGRA